MLPINYLINLLAKRPKEAHVTHPLHQPTALFRQEACGYADAWDYYSVTTDAGMLIQPPTVDPREPIVADIWDYTSNSFLFPLRD